MLLLVILIIVVILCVAFFINVPLSKIESSVGLILAWILLLFTLIVSIMGVGTILATALSKNSTVKSFETKYEAVSYYIEIYDAEKDTDYAQLRTLLNDIKKINENIEVNKKKHNNMYIGMCYSEKIASYEPLVMKKINKVTEKEILILEK